MKKSGLLGLLFAATMLAASFVILNYEGRLKLYALAYNTLGCIVLCYHCSKKDGQT